MTKYEEIKIETIADCKQFIAHENISACIRYFENQTDYVGEIWAIIFGITLTVFIYFFFTGVGK